MTNFERDQAPAKRQKTLKKFENSFTKTATEKSITMQTPLGSVIVFARRSRKFEHAPHYLEVCSPTLDK
jgi:hypothetical protein